MVQVFGRLIAALALVWTTSASADLFVGTVTFEGEENAEQAGRLHFTLDQVSWKGEAYQPQTPTRFALESRFGGGVRADLVLLQSDGVGKTVFSPFPYDEGANGNGLAHLGTSAASPAMAQAIRNWQVPERAVTGWIIANAQELIGLAIASGKMSSARATSWSAEAALFERLLREGATPLRTAIALADRRELEAQELTIANLIPVVQPGLKALGYYEGAVDGFWGGNTRNGAQAFQLSLNAVPTGWLTLEQLGQLRQAYGASLTRDQAAVLPWSGNAADLDTVRAQANTQISSLNAAMNQLERDLKDTQAAREMAVAALRDSQQKLAELEAQPSTQPVADTAELASLRDQISRLSNALADKTQQVDELKTELAATAAAQTAEPDSEDSAALLVKLQESKQTIAALNAQLSSSDGDDSVPVQRFNSVRDTLTQRVSTLNSMLVQERDNTTNYRNKWFEAQADLDEFQAACRAEPACAEAMGLN